MRESISSTINLPRPTAAFQRYGNGSVIETPMASDRSVFYFLAILVTLSIGSGVRLIGATQDVKIEKKNGHASPLAATLTAISGAKRQVMVLGFGSNIGSYYSHNLTASGEDDSSIVNLWLDTIKVIRETTNEDFTVVMKDESSRRLQWKGYNCNQSRNQVPEYDCSYLFIASPEGGKEVVNLQKIRAVEFGKPARKDSAGNAMFEAWVYSPFTGEKLPVK